MAQAYETVADARNALCLDTGFDPFTTGHILGRCTKAKLAELGYPVDPELARCQRAEAARLESERKAAEDRCAAAEERGRAAKIEEALDLDVMQRVADEVAATGAPVAEMHLYGDRRTGCVRLTYHDGRHPTSHRLT